MKHMKKIMITLLALVMCLSLVACGGEKKDPTPSSDNTASSTEPNSGDATETKDLSNPEIVVELNDHEAMQDLAKKMQNFEVAEGTVIKVTGTVSRNTSIPSLMAELSDGAKIGISVHIDDAPDDNTPAEGETVTVVGVAQKGDFIMEFHAKMENVKYA